MPLPNDVPTFTLVAEFPPLSPDGTERQGEFTFTPIPAILPSPDAIYLGVENATLNATGGMTKDLIANDAFADEFAWRVDGAIDGLTPFSVTISVPASVGTVNLGAVAEFETLPPDYLVIPGPQGPEGPAGEGGGGTGTPSSTVVAGTSFGQSSTAGVATAYSRGDHSHGTPATPTKATVGLGNVDNTSDLGKPLSTAATNALAGKADLVGGTVPLAQLPTPSVQGALTKTSNLSDLANAGTARTNLGLGTAAVAAATAFDAAGAAATAQSAAGTYTDGKIASEVTRANAAYDAAGAASTVAGNLTAHTGATTSVHGIANTSALVTTSDTRLTNSRTPSGSAGGDLGGTYPSPTVAKVNGVAVSGTPSSGQVLTASSGTAASWQTPSGGGGGGTAPVLYIDEIDAGIITLTPQADWTPVVGSTAVPIRRVVENVTPGDVMQFTASFLGIGTVYELDARILLGDGSGAARYLSSADGDSASGPEGYAPWYRQLSFTIVNGFATFVVAEEEIDSDGNWTIEQVYRGQSITGTDSRLYWGGGYRGRWDVWHWPFGS